VPLGLLLVRLVGVGRGGGGRRRRWRGRPDRPRGVRPVRCRWWGRGTRRRLAGRRGGGPGGLRLCSRGGRRL